MYQIHSMSHQPWLYLETRVIISISCSFVVMVHNIMVWVWHMIMNRYLWWHEYVRVRETTFVAQFRGKCELMVEENIFQSIDIEKKFSNMKWPPMMLQTFLQVLEWHLHSTDRLRIMVFQLLLLFMWLVLCSCRENWKKKKHDDLRIRWDRQYAHIKCTIFIDFQQSH